MATNTIKKNGVTINQATTDKEKSIVVNNIIVRPIERGVQDIAKWRRAMIFAESIQGNRVDLYDLYEDILLDGHLSSVIEKRINAVKRAAFSFTNADGTSNDELNKFVDTLAFETLITEIINTKLWGFTVLEYLPDSKSFYAVPRKHIRPRLQMIVSDQRGIDGMDYTQPPANRFIVEMGNREDLGIMLKVCQYVIYKRGGFGDWAQFAELFGMPFREARYDGYDEKTRKDLEFMMEKAGSAPYAVLPKEAEFKIHPNNSTGSKDVYSGLNDACNAEISKTILGNTETTESSKSSGYAQSETHKEGEGELNETDETYVRRILNEKIVPLLEMHGWPVKGGKFVIPKSPEKIPMKDRVDVDLKLAKVIPISKTYFYETYNIPVPEAGEEIVEIAAPTAPAPPEQDPPPTNKEMKKMMQLMQRFFLKARNVETGRIQQLNLQLNDLYAHHCAACDTITLASEDQQEKLIAQILKDVFDQNLQNNFSTKSAAQIANIIMKAVVEGYGNNFPSLTTTAPDYLQLAALEANVYEFSGAKSWQMCRELTTLLIDDAGVIRSFGSFKSAAGDVMDRYVGNWLRTEYNHAIASAQMASKWVDIKQTQSGLPNLTYSAVMDARTRLDHRQLNDITQPIDAPFWAKYYPPNGFGCRCTALPSSSRKITTPEKMQALPDVPKGFDQNLAAMGKIFPPEHPYYNNVPPAVLQTMRDMKTAR